MNNTCIRLTTIRDKKKRLTTIIKTIANINYIFYDIVLFGPFYLFGLTTPDYDIIYL